MLLPNRLLKLNINNDFRFWQFLTSSFVNHNFQLYVGNLVGFVLFGLIALIILSNYDSKTKLIFYISIYSILPIIVSIITYFILITYNYTGSFCGNSTITSGIVYFVLFWFLFISIKLNRILRKNKKFNFWLLFFAIIISLFALFYGYFLIFESKLNLGHLIGIIFGIIMALIFLRKYDIKKWRLK